MSLVLEYKFIDSHAHLSSPEVGEEAEWMILRAYKKKVETIINVCTDSDSLRRGLMLQKKHPGVFSAAGTPPHDIEGDYEEDFSFIASQAQEKKLVAIGEIGLDYYYKELPKEKQFVCLERYLSLAQECGLPVIFHCREAFSDLFSFCDENFRGIQAVLHCFTGNIEEAEEVVKRGWYVSFSGIVTFKKSEALRETLQVVPLEQLLIETDTPYLAPQSKRGKPNEPSYLPEIAEVIALEKKTDVLEIAEATSANARRLFSLAGNI